MKFIKNITGFSIAVVLVVIFFEVFLSTAGILQQSFFIHPEKGERYISNKTVNTLFIMEGFGLTRSNENGWLGNNVKIDKNKNDKSIAFLGNSFVASRQVFERNHFLTRSEKLLNNELKDKKVQLLNFGKKNMYLEELLYLKEEIEKEYNPDYIVVFLNERSLGKMRKSQLVPYYEEVNDSLQLNTSFRNSGKLKLYTKLGDIVNSSFVYLAYRVKGKFNEAPEIILDKFYVKKDESIGSPSAINLSDVQTRILNELSLDEKVLFLTDLNKENLEIVVPIIMKRPIINLKELLLKFEKESNVNPYEWKVTNDVGHWNNKAHQVIGDELSKELLKYLR